MPSKDLLKNILNYELQLKNLKALTTQKNSASFLENLSKEEFPVSVSVILSLPKDSISRKYLTYLQSMCTWVCVNSLLRYTLMLGTHKKLKRGWQSGGVVQDRFSTCCS